MDFTRAVQGALRMAVVASICGGTCLAADKSTFSVKVTSASALAPKEPGGTTARIHAEIMMKNDGDGVIGVSPRQLSYELREKLADDKLGEPHRFFGITEPDLRDARPLEPGQSVKLDADLEGHTIGVDAGAKYLLIVTNPNNDNAKQQVEVTFK
jgi:hypothetical protein